MDSITSFLIYFIPICQELKPGESVKQASVQDHQLIIVGIMQAFHNMGKGVRQTKY